MLFGWLNLRDLNNMERLRLGRKHGRGRGGEDREEDKAKLEEKVRLPDVSRVLTPFSRDNSMISTCEFVKAAFVFLSSLWWW